MLKECLEIARRDLTSLEEAIEPIESLQYSPVEELLETGRETYLT